MDKEQELYILLEQLLSWYNEAIIKFGDPSYRVIMSENCCVIKYYMDILANDYRRVKAKKPNTPPSTVAANASK